MKYKLRNFNIPLVPIPKNQAWIEVSTKDGRGPFVWVHINDKDGGRPKGRGRPPGKKVLGGRRISLRHRPGRIDWTGKLLMWHQSGDFWMWTQQGPAWGSAFIIE